MKKALIASLLPLTLATTPVMASEDAGSEVDPRVLESRATVKQFAKTLKGELMSAIKQGGPVNGIQICNQRAPEIAKNISEEKGWEVGRTSLKTRNANNEPDAWEAQVLKQFEERHANGEKPKSMEYYEVVENNGSKEFRYMKAIGVGGKCLTCHGTSIPEPVKAKLDTLYPNDNARGYTLGQIRGAFTITQPIE